MFDLKTSMFCFVFLAYICSAGLVACVLVRICFFAKINTLSNLKKNQIMGFISELGAFTWTENGLIEHK